MKMSRREFFVRSLQGAALMTVPAFVSTLLQSCNANVSDPNTPGNNGSSGGLQTIQGNVSNGKVVINIDNSSSLAKAGSAAIVQTSSGSILVDRASDTQFYALSPICTHEGCAIDTFDSSNNQFVCRCHGSRFSANGQVTQGPARSPLSQYQTQFTNNQLSITL